MSIQDIEAGSRPGAARMAAGDRGAPVLSLGSRLLWWPGGDEPGASAAQAFTGKAAVVLAWVMLEGGADRRRLAGMLWPRSGEAQARNNLRVLVHRINQRFGADLLGGTDRLQLHGVQLQVGFAEAAAVLAALEAGGVARCELLGEAGADDDAEDALQEWLDDVRQRHRRQQLIVLSQAQAQAQVQGEHEQAQALARACVRLEPLSEARHRQLMEALAQGGNRAAALAAYEDCKALLKQQLGILPDLLTRTVQLRILQQQALEPQEGRGAGAATETVAPAADAAAATPAPPEALSPLGGAARYPLVEREALLQRLQAAWRQGQHVALHGEPGVGKTRLLRELAGQPQVQAEQVAVRSGIRDDSFAALAQLIQEVQLRRQPRLDVSAQIELARLVPQVFPQVQPSQAGLSVPRLHAALRQWLQALREAGVQLLVLDDVQQADTASKAALAALLGEAADVAGLPALLLAWRSADVTGELAQALATAQAHGRAVELALPRLSLQGVQALLQAIAAGGAAATGADQLLRRTGGNPLFVIELAQQQREQGGTDARGLQALLAARLGGCSLAAQQLATVAAVADEEFSAELAVAVTQQPLLALMPAWTELQQRGLFADHGLAHDLVRDAVLAQAPQAIRRTLHRQIARHLEGLGLVGGVVKRHWIAADDADGALPHAVHQMYQQRALGLPSARPAYHELHELMRRAGDAALRAHLWATTAVELQDLDPPMLDHINALVGRMQAHEDEPEVGAWLACAQQLIQGATGRSPRVAYDQLVAAAGRLPEQGRPRAEVEQMLWRAALHSGQSTKPHVELGLKALDGLPDSPELRPVREGLMLALSYSMPFAQSLKMQANRLREARRRHDLGAAAHARGVIGELLLMNGYVSKAFRHFEIHSPESVHTSTDLQAGQLAAAVDRFDLAIASLGRARGEFERAGASILLSMVWLRLGRYDRARECIRDLSPTTHGGRLINLSLARARRLLALQDGSDPMAALHEVHRGMQEFGAPTPRLEVIRWWMRRATLAGAERAGEGRRVLDLIEQDLYVRAFKAEILLDVAEAETDVERRRSSAHEAARYLRRRGVHHVDLVRLTCRCADLLQATDPAEAHSLRQVARRWVVQALPHVPADSLHSYVYAVPVHLELLGEDAEAAAAGRLRWGAPPTSG